MNSINKISVAIFLLTVFAWVSCQRTPDLQKTKQLISSTKQYFVPDSRVAIFNVKADITNGGKLLLKGETNLPDAKAALFDSLAEYHSQASDSIHILPSADLGNQAYGIVNNSVANIRSEPAHSAQLATQATLGMPLKIFKKQPDWYLVQTPDDYISWVDHGGLQVMNKQEYEAWVSAPKVIYLHTYGFSYKEPSTSSQKISDLVIGNILKLNGSTGSFYNVEYPDGRTAYIAQKEARPYDQWQKGLHPTEQSLVNVAMKMMGVPYLWGGTSSKGVDCSGFTKTIFLMNGVIIPRDASQQVHAGTLIDSTRSFDNLQIGDLLFFGKPATDIAKQKVVHVGMWIGNNQFIHSSERVRISSFDSTAVNFDPYNLNRYLETRRYLNNWNGNILDVAHMYDIVEP